ncbi:MAG TPA: branched-chain amino acid ABC transporter substrate-binding protein [Actinomycetota bacterium]|nr:branched-chain amino acid ABC transporter substrate-binding protein [Actinomycetota bacterium]
MKRSKWMQLLAVLAALALLAGACGGNGGDGDGDGNGTSVEEKVPVSITFQGALTGPFNYLVIPAFQGAQLRINELNEDPDFPAEITLERGDTQGSGDNAPPVVEEAVSNPDTVAVIGPAFSGESAASGDSYNEAGIPFVTPSATNTALNEEGWDYWYRACGNDAAQGSLAGQYIADTLKPSSLFVSHDKSEYGQPLAETVRDTAEEAGVEIVGFEGVESGAEDFSAFISAVKASGADALFFGGYDADFGKIVKQARDSGVDITMMSGDGSLSSTFLDLAGNGADNVVLIAPTNLSGDFVDKYQGEYGGEASSVPVYAAEGYDVASLLGEGIRSAIEGGAEDAESIRAGIKEYLDGLAPGSEFQGVAKPYAFDDVHEVVAEDPASLFYLYEVTAGELNPLGSAAELLGSA